MCRSFAYSLQFLVLCFTGIPMCTFMSLGVYVFLELLLLIFLFIFPILIFYFNLFYFLDACLSSNERESRTGWEGFG